MLLFNTLLLTFINIVQNGHQVPGQAEAGGDQEGGSQEEEGLPHCRRVSSITQANNVYCPSSPFFDRELIFRNGQDL